MFGSSLHSFPAGLVSIAIIVCLSIGDRDLTAAGTLQFTIANEDTGEPVVARVELTRSAITPGGRVKIITPRRTAKAGIGFILDRSVDLELGDGGYQFRIIRGPEYRIITGNFSLARTSEDSHHVDLPRMVSMREQGWLSGDMAVTEAGKSLPIRMAGDDLHVSVTTLPTDAPEKTALGSVRGSKDPLQYEPLWIIPQLQLDRGLAFYSAERFKADEIAKSIPVENLVALKTPPESDVKAAIENPFAMALPVWLASQKVDGFFVLGDWLRLDRSSIRRPKSDRSFDWKPTGTHDWGRWAETIYWNTLEAGFHLVPLAGGGDETGNTPVGYNRTYATTSTAFASSGVPERLQSPETQQQWRESVWSGRTMVTNGPMLRATANQFPPGHRFQPRPANTNAEGQITIEIQVDLATRDPVDYMEVIHNGEIHYTARLDEFAKAGGKIPAIQAERSGWFLVRVVTLYPDHFRVASTAPWFIEIGGQPRVTTQACRFFEAWLADYETYLKNETPERIGQQSAFVRAARQFWAQRSSEATVSN